MTLQKHQRDWESLGEMDPFWAILSDPTRKHGKWDRDDFFQTGRREIADLMARVPALGRPRERKAALDFGCGVGRLTRALAEHFDRCVGVDISEPMIRQARELNRAAGNCEFHVNARDDLSAYADNAFDLIYTVIVLQHLPRRRLIRSYLAEFVRVLRPDGLLVFQLPSGMTFRKRLQPRSRLYALLRSLGVRERFLYERLGLTPIRMNYLSEEETVAFLTERGAKVLMVQKDTLAGPGIESRTYYVAGKEG